nr:uncharacterized protein LOC113840984 isoform X2 [Anas platyrhynchos]
MRASGCGPGSGSHRKLTAQPPAEPQASAPPYPAQSKAETRSRRCSPKAAPQNMLWQAPWARLSPSGPAILLLVICGSMSSQDICSSPGDLQAPALQMNSTSAQPGTTVVLQCILHVFSHTRRIIFCKDGKEVYSQEAQQGQLSYSVVLNITSRSAGRYTCGYQQRNEMKQRRSSALSAGRILNVPGAGAGVTTQDIGSSSGNVVSSPASPPPPGSSPSHKAQLPSRGSAMPLEVWILRSALSLLLLLSAPIITLLLERCSHSASEARQPGDIPVPMEL